MSHHHQSQRNVDKSDGHNLLVLDYGECEGTDCKGICLEDCLQSEVHHLSYPCWYCPQIVPQNCYITGLHYCNVTEEKDDD